MMLFPLYLKKIRAELHVNCWDWNDIGHFVVDTTIDNTKMLVNTYNKMVGIRFKLE